MVFPSPLRVFRKGYHAGQGTRVLRLDFGSTIFQNPPLLQTIVGLLAHIATCFLGCQAKTSTLLPATKITKGYKGGGMGVSQRQETSQALQQNSQCTNRYHCTGAACSRRPEALPTQALYLAWRQAHILERVFAAVQSHSCTLIYHSPICCELGIFLPVLQGCKSSNPEKFKKSTQSEGSKDQEAVPFTHGPSRHTLLTLLYYPPKEGAWQGCEHTHQVSSLEPDHLTTHSQPSLGPDVGSAGAYRLRVNGLLGTSTKMKGVVSQISILHHGHMCSQFPAETVLTSGVPLI